MKIRVQWLVLISVLVGCTPKLFNGVGEEVYIDLEDQTGPGDSLVLNRNGLFRMLDAKANRTINGTWSTKHSWLTLEPENFQRSLAVENVDALADSIEIVHYDFELSEYRFHCVFDCFSNGDSITVEFNPYGSGSLSHYKTHHSTWDSVRVVADDLFRPDTTYDVEYRPVIYPEKGTRYTVNSRFTNQGFFVERRFRLKGNYLEVEWVNPINEKSYNWLRRVKRRHK